LQQTSPAYALAFGRSKLAVSRRWLVALAIVIDQGTARSITTTTLTQDVYAFPFGHGGLMAGIGIEGSEITQITPY
jgi:hypothetical protein